jgi:hypothetical protein
MGVVYKYKKYKNNNKNNDNKIELIDISKQKNPINNEATSISSTSIIPNLEVINLKELEKYKQKSSRKCHNREATSRSGISIKLSKEDKDILESIKTGSGFKIIKNS